jgi:hypothetical protein
MYVNIFFLIFTSFVVMKMTHGMERNGIEKDIEKNIVKNRGNGSYNSMVNQIGFCRMQSFDTQSRSSSGSVPMFMDGRISFGVGLSDMNMKEVSYFRCGECLQVLDMKPFYSWNNELTEWTERTEWTENADSSSLFLPFIIMVFDQCTDPICVRDYLDFDIYSALQPVSHGNPTNIEWISVPCPILEEETIEYLFCLSTSCHVEDPEDTNMTLRRRTAPSLIVYYWSLTIRNTRIPILSVIAQYQNDFFFLKRQNAWVWDFGPFDLEEDIVLTMEDKEGEYIQDTIKMSDYLDKNTTNGYHGGILISSSVQN